MKLGPLITLQYHSLKEVGDVAITYVPVSAKQILSKSLFISLIKILTMTAEVSEIHFDYPSSFQNKVCFRRTGVVQLALL